VAGLTDSAGAPIRSGARGRLPELALVLVTVIWGGTFLITQIALRESSPFGLLALRFTIGALALALCFAATLRGLTRGEVRAGVVIGIASFASYSLQTFGLQHIASSKSAFITALYVPIVPLLQIAVLRRVPGAAATLGIVISFAGLMLLSVNEGFELSFGVGEWLTLGSAVAAAFQIVLLSRYAAASDPRRLTLVQLCVVAVLSAAAMPLAGESLPPLTPVVLGAALGLGLIATAVALALMAWAQQTVSATRATVIYALEPVWGGGVGAAAGEPMTPPIVGGSAMIVLGVLVSSLRLGRGRVRRRRARRDVVSASGA
jgi:drug/metabolite transporter (DMT)-like permease